jgi:hypothetical protein
LQATKPFIDFPKHYNMNANDTLREHNCSDNFYQYSMGMLLTDGAKALAERFKCYWFLDIVCSYQPGLRQEEFQVWKLKRMKDDSAVVCATDGNNKVLVTQGIEYTDFEAVEATLWVEGQVILLPSEH